MVVRLTVSFCQELVRVTLGEPTSATCDPPAARSRSLSCTEAPTDWELPALTQAVAVYARPGTVEVTVNALSSIVNDVPGSA